MINILKIIFITFLIRLDISIIFFIEETIENQKILYMICPSMNYIWAHAENIEKIINFNK